MMKILSLLLVFLALSTTFGCEDILKEKAYGQIANSDFWNTEQDAEMAIKAALDWMGVVRAARLTLDKSRFDQGR